MSRIGDAVFGGIVTGLVVGLPTIAIHVAKQTARNANDLTPIVQQIAKSSDTLTTTALRSLDPDAITNHLIKVVRETPEFIASRQDYETRFLAEHIVAFASPDNSYEFSNIFLREGTQVEVERASKTSSQFHSAFENSAQRMPKSSDLTRLLNEGNESVVIVVAHNESGAMRFADGSAMKINSFADECERLRKRCIVLSCDSSNHLSNDTPSTAGINLEITFEEALRISRGLSNDLNGRLRWYESALKHMPKEEVEFMRTTTIFGLDVSVREYLAVLESATRTMRHVEKSAKIVKLSTVSATIVYSIDRIEENAE